MRLNSGGIIANIAGQIKTPLEPFRAGQSDKKFNYFPRINGNNMRLASCVIGIRCGGRAGIKNEKSFGFKSSEKNWTAKEGSSASLPAL